MIGSLVLTVVSSSAEWMMTMKNNGFGERLKTLLKQNKMTQAQVAAAVRTSVPSVNRWTKGGEIEYTNLRALADFLDVNWIWLRYGDEAIASLQSDMPANNAMTDLRKEYLNQIIDNEAKMKSALEMAEIVNWEWNVLTGTVTCSQNAEAIFGVETSHLPNCMLPFAEAPIDELEETFGQPQPHTWDFAIQAEDGSEKWFSSRARLVYDAAKRPAKVIGISADITARKTTENALAESEYMMRKIIDLIPVGLWAADAEGKICLANPEVKRIWGGAKYVGLEQYGEYKGWWEESGEPVGAEGWTLARAVKNGETSQPETVKIKAFDGQHRIITMFSTPLYNQQDQLIGAIEVNQDISDIKAAEHSLKSSLEEWEIIFQQPLFGVLQLNGDQISRVSEALVKAFPAAKNQPCSLDDIFVPDTRKDIEDYLTAKPLASAIFDGSVRGSEAKRKIYLLPQNHAADNAPQKTMILFAMTN